MQATSSPAPSASIVLTAVGAAGGEAACREWSACCLDTPDPFRRRTHVEALRHDEQTMTKHRPPPPGPRLLRIRAAAAALRVSEKTVRRLIERGELRPHRIGRALRVSEEDLGLYLSRCRA